MNYPLYIFFGLAPSIVWLLFYLKKDVHPESNSMILKIFGYGMLAAIPTAIIELGALKSLELISLPPVFTMGLICFLGVALPEEMMKYLVVRAKVLSNPELDEPIDVMLYMIIFALGFAGLENILVRFPFGGSFEFLTVSWIRFIGATFLHALCAGLIGYFLALSFLKTEKRVQLTIIGLGSAIVLHGLYDFFIIIEGSLKLAGPTIILVGLAIFVSYGFKKVKKIKSVCLFSKN